MRGHNVLEAYLDDYDLIKFYFNKISYGGKSNCFYLKNNTDKVQPLEIIKIEEHTNYFVYHLKVENIEIGENYFVEHEYARTTPLQYGYITKTKKFDEQFYYDKNDLGATFLNNTTTFKVFAPTANKIQILLKDKEVYMKKENGIFTVTFDEYLHNTPYRYRVFCNGKIQETIDPYCIQTTKNATHSIAFDTSILQQSTYVQLEKYTDAIIYEASIADFTAQYPIHPSTYLSMANDNSVNYLKQLGISHLQLLPVTSCGSTDDYLPNLHYNWGYDITHFQALTNRYAIENSVKEFRYLVQTYHQNNIGIVLDMVFNHVHDYDTSPLQILVPHYYFQENSNGQMSNGTYCGNDFDSTRKMASKLVVDSCISWVKHFGIDGFRFDLMGILDVDTMNAVYDACVKLNPSFILYGEGWHMTSYLEDEKRASMVNHEKMPDIAHFNDYFRDILKGKQEKSGFLTGADFSGDAAQNAFLCKNFINPKNSINYFECHDNHTLWDYLTLIEKDEAIRMKKMKLLNAAVFLSLGIPFIHSGQEFARTKNLLDNTYRDNSGVNVFDWKKTQHSLVEYIKKLIQIRKNYPQLRQANTIENIEIGYVDTDIIYYTLDKLTVIFNPTSNSSDYKISGYEVFSNQKIESLTIEPYSVYVVDHENSCSV